MKKPAVVFVSMLVILLASACAPTQPITEPVAVIEAFHDALNDGDLDAAMNFVADDARIILDTLHEGKAEVRSFYEETVSLNSRWELSDINVEGDTVTWTSHVTLGPGGKAAESILAVVQDGKIVSLRGN